MQPTRQAPQRLGPPERPGRRITSTVFSPKGGPSPAVASLLHLRAGDIETSPGPHCYACGNPVRHGTSVLRCSTTKCSTVSRKQFVCSGLHRSNLLNRWQFSPHGGPGPQRQQFPPTTTFCDSFRLPIRRGTRPLTCDAPDCQAQLHAARRCNGAATHQGRWWSRQHRKLRETVADRPATELQQHHNPTTIRCTCVGCKRTIAISLLLCSWCESTYHRSCSVLTRDAATAALRGGSWICNRCAVVPPAGRIPLHSPERKFQNLHVARASPRCASDSGMQMVFPPKCRSYVTDWQPKASTCA